ncbi:MAG: nicotinamide-nucleotide amidohydrolase family protein [Actinomycetales bacterium]|nr:nicotinamide-nucleotide amidohydrolase family protein [Actinomycetales bacterium]
MSLTESLVEQLLASGRTLAVAESLTGGALTAALVGIPGVSAVLRGGVVAYATDLKAQLLGVDPALLEAEGPVHPEVALQMAEGVRRALGADVGLATTGVAGPAEQNGRGVGTVCVACTADGVARVRAYRLAGSRAAVRASTVSLALALARGALTEQPGSRTR